MYRLPDGQRGALRQTSLALAREASRDDGRSSDTGSSTHLNPFKGIKRLYNGFRKHKSSARSHSPAPSDDGRLRKFYSLPLYASDNTNQNSKSYSSEKRRTSDDGVVEGSSKGASAYPSPPLSPTKPRKRVHFNSSTPEVSHTYSAEEYDRRVVDPWELMTRESRAEMRNEMVNYTRNEMQLNDVYNTNDSTYCTLCWRKHCHCRALSKDIWKRAKSTSMVRAGA
ncbi:hypothetical protein DL89DRAFT_260385 [Linderina pennispora]|uniref:Uncharacterized protein n=1 Tax=Linderina pennispora TaxID=61395 RepID=A0A1Y1VZC4_9FUNG|nr:uncharacterized protein DL89DRAFT_260385 [Linderina pennispora]ORX66366.1 hypothetical protein DL89DRAFT_260385 [Linderina pennispora]